ncbi:MAG: ATP-binding protein [Pyrinomonadaceae bacterium]
MKAPLPQDEVARLAALQQLGVLDTAPEATYDGITRLAAHICQTPVALVSLVDADRQWFKARTGLDATETPRDVAFCAHAILQTDLFIVPDALADERFKDNPLVTSHPKIRFYAGAPLITANGHALGTICVTDTVPRTLTAEQQEALRVLARLTATQLELRRNTLALARANAELDREIAERRRVEQERAESLQREQAARAAAEAANRAKDEFLATVSHELRTPLTSMMGWVELLQLGMLDEAGRAHALEVITKSAQAQAQLIGDLLDISRIVSGRLRLDMQAVELANVIEAAADVVRPAAEAKAIQLRTEFAPAVGAVAGDPDRLQQVIWNLLANAVKFTPKGGTVEIRLAQRDAHAEISVADNGAGIAPDLLPYVFDRFRQGDSTTTRQHGGLGLGLAIVRHLVELHGGTVAAESAGSGQGATFRLHLPLIAAQPKTDAAARHNGTHKNSLVQA